MTLLAGDDNGYAVQALGQGVCQNLAFTGTSAASAAFGTGTRVIRIKAIDQDCWFRISAAPEAATDGTSSYLHAGETEVWKVAEGDSIAAISAGTNGTLNITELT